MKQNESNVPMIVAVLLDSIREFLDLDRRSGIWPSV